MLLIMIISLHSVFEKGSCHSPGLEDFLMKEMKNISVEGFSARYVKTRAATFIWLSCDLCV